MFFQSVLALERDLLQKFLNASYNVSLTTDFAEFKDLAICRIRPAYKPNSYNPTTQIDVIVHPTNDELTRFSITQTLIFSLSSEPRILKQSSVLDAIHQRIKNNNAEPLKELLLGLEQIVTLLQGGHVKTLPIAKHLHSVDYVVNGICHKCQNEETHV